MAISTLIGIFLGTISSVIIDRRSKFIFNLNDINKNSYFFLEKLR